MSIDGTALARVMLSIHVAEMEQAERCPAWRREARMERQMMLYPKGNRAICWLGCLLERLGSRLREYGMRQTLPLGIRPPVPLRPTLSQGSRLD